MIIMKIWFHVHITRVKIKLSQSLLLAELFPFLTPRFFSHSTFFRSLGLSQKYRFRRNARQDLWKSMKIIAKWIVELIFERWQIEIIHLMRSSFPRIICYYKWYQFYVRIGILVFSSLMQSAFTILWCSDLNVDKSWFTRELIFVYKSQQNDK